jgi:peptide/nickel transport system permease protein
VFRYIIRRIVLLVVVVFGVTVITFVLARVVPQNVAAVWAGFQGFKATGDVIQQLEEEYHLRDPLYLQYLYYLRDLVQGNWGRSPVTTRPVIEDIKAFLPNTVELGAAGLLLAIVVGIPTGVISATRRNSGLDHLSRLVALAGVSLPGFWVGLILQLIFYYQLGWIPDPGGRLSQVVQFTSPVQQQTGFLLVDSLVAGNWVAFRSALQHLLLPALTLALPVIALISRMTRSAMLEVLGQEYVRTARAKGLTERVVEYRHALRNAWVPITTVVATSFGWLLTGSVVTEVVFSWPGIGRYAVGAVLSFDFPAIMIFTVITAVVYALVNLIADLLYLVLDPRISYG